MTDITPKQTPWPELSAAQIKYLAQDDDYQMDHIHREQVAWMAGELLALRQRSEAAERRAYDLAVAIMGGEDAPGYADSIPTQALVEQQRDMAADWMEVPDLRAALTAANARADAAWNAAIEALGAKLADMLRATAQANASNSPEYARDMREWADDVLAEASALRKGDDATVTALQAQAEELEADVPCCSDCPPLGYPSDKTRCVGCPRAALALATDSTGGE